MVGGQLNDAVTEADILRALARGAEKDLGRRAVRILFQEVVLDFPGVVEAQPIGQFHLVERVVEELSFAIRFPGAG